MLAYAVKLHDKGDGQGVDGAKVAGTLFKTQFQCLDNAKGDARALSIARRVQDIAYTRMAGPPDPTRRTGRKRRLSCLTPVCFPIWSWIADGFLPA